RREVRIERVVLEPHGDVALLRAELVDHTLADADRARRGLLETGDQAEHRGLPAARRSHEDHELAVVDGEREVREGARPAGIDLVDVLELDARHFSRRTARPPAWGVPSRRSGRKR